MSEFDLVGFIKILTTVSLIDLLLYLRNFYKD